VNRIHRLGRVAEQLAQDAAAAASVAVGHQTGRRDGGTLAAATATRSPRRAVTAARLLPRTMARLLPRTIQLCIHCRHNPAGFWVSSPGGQTARRPWCLACCQGLDRDRCAVIPFDSYPAAQ
jgi:hypothetical protein